MTTPLVLGRKVCLLGDFAVGKTSLARRFVYDRFDDTYISTIGVKVSRKVVMVPRADRVVEVALIVWDLAGSEEFGAVRASYLRGAAGALLVFDLSRPETLERLPAYAAQIRQTSPAAPLAIAANKVDLVADPATVLAEANAMAARLGAPIVPTSAKRGDAVEDLFRNLAERLAGEG
ncbi:GTP-binding protein [bacterium]|nr:GTP-binding protein [Chloroflexi bacterium CFX6]RIL12679.1 MAG: GTP-binding protein [bacterium]